MIFFSGFTNYMMLSSISVSIVQMVGQPTIVPIPACKRVKGGTTTKEINRTQTTHRVYDWTESQKSDILGGYFWGYLMTIILGGVLSERIGPWHVLLWSSLLAAISTALVPLFADLGYVAVTCARVVVGMCGGVAYPAINTLMASWAPPQEKGKFVAASLGNTFGMVVTFAVVGAVTHATGWPWGFYVLAMIMVTYCLFFGFIVSDEPEKSRCTSQEERDFILESQEGHLNRKKKKFPPFLKIFSSKPFLTLTFCQFGSLWGLYQTVTYLPSFLSNTIGLELDTASSLAGLPYLARGICCFIFGIVGDWMRKKKIMSVTNIRKFFIIFSHFIPAVCCFLIPAAGCSAAGIVILVMIMQGSNGSVAVSNLINPQDLAPNFAGTVFGIMQTFATFAGAIVPKVTSAFLDYYDREYIASTIAFAIAGGVYVICGLAFVLFGSGETQPWNEIPD
ncbi:hypothetical protein Zmor_024729 [Zophobas morio]|uniref:Major facilitator superfamily (MFS) profile domain-containing protein n=2 Tax=Zophobas morio TaxID=2755281 RepID=A0AA38M8T8_9CUCU|nr:hypothetical protein Zmor_024729 [Zophobas morio]